MPSETPVPRSGMPRGGPGRRPLSPRVRRNRTIAAALVLGLLLLLVAKCTTMFDGESGGVGRAAPAAQHASRGTSGGGASGSPEGATSTAAAEDNAEAGPTGQASSGSANDFAPPITPKGTGTFTPVDIPGTQQPATTGRPVTYSVEVEGGLTGVDPKEFAATVEKTLLDPRGWQGVDGIRWVHVTPAQEAAGTKVDIKVTLESPGTVDAMCAPMQTRGQVSCWNKGRANLNLRRYELATDTYGTDLADYRAYQISHEVGHGLGHNHVSCPGPGQHAPVMLQQSYHLEGCVRWPWPKRD